MMAGSEAILSALDSSRSFCISACRPEELQRLREAGDVNKSVSCETSHCKPEHNVTVTSQCILDEDPSSHCNHGAREPLVGQTSANSLLYIHHLIDDETCYNAPRQRFSPSNEPSEISYASCLEKQPQSAPRPVGLPDWLPVVQFQPIDYIAKSNQYTGLELGVGQQANLLVLGGLACNIRYSGPIELASQHGLATRVENHYPIHQATANGSLPESSAAHRGAMNAPPLSSNGLPQSLPSIASLPGHGNVRNGLMMSEFISCITRDEAFLYQRRAGSNSMNSQDINNHRSKRDSDQTRTLGVSSNVWQTTSEEAWHRSFNSTSAPSSSNMSRTTSTGPGDTPSANSAPPLSTTKRAVKAAILVERILRKALMERQNRPQESQSKEGGYRAKEAKIPFARKSGYPTTNFETDSEIVEAEEPERLMKFIHCVTYDHGDLPKNMLYSQDSLCRDIYEKVFLCRLVPQLSRYESDRLTTYKGRATTKGHMRDFMLSEIETLVEYMVIGGSTEKSNFRLDARIRFAVDPEYPTMEEIFNHEVDVLVHRNLLAFIMRDGGKLAFPLKLGKGPLCDMPISESEPYPGLPSTPFGLRKPGYEESDAEADTEADAGQVDDVSGLDSSCRRVLDCNSSSASVNVQTGPPRKTHQAESPPKIPEARCRGQADEAEILQDAVSSFQGHPPPLPHELFEAHHPRQFGGMLQTTGSGYGYPSYRASPYIHPGQPLFFSTQAPLVPPGLMPPGLVAPGLAPPGLAQPGYASYPGMQVMHRAPAMVYGGPMNDRLARAPAPTRIAGSLQANVALQTNTSTQATATNSPAASLEWNNRFSSPTPAPVPVPALPRENVTLPYRSGADTMFPRPYGGASIRYQNLTRDERSRLSVVADERNLPFIETARQAKSAEWGVMKISNIPYDITSASLHAFLGTHAKIITPDLGPAIHVMMDRFTGKTQEAFIEFFSTPDARAWVNLIKCRPAYSNKIGDRILNVDLSSQEELMREIFPRTKCVTWKGGEDGKSVEVVEPEDAFDSGFKGFVTVEELQSLVRHAEQPHRSIYTQKCPARPYASFITLLAKFPWYATSLYNIGTRNAIHAATMTLIRSLVSILRRSPSSSTHSHRVQSSGDGGNGNGQLVFDDQNMGNSNNRKSGGTAVTQHGFLGDIVSTFGGSKNGDVCRGFSDKLLKDLVMAGLNAYGFSERQRWEIYTAAQSVLGREVFRVSPFANVWPLETLGRGRAFEEDVVEFYANLIRAHPATGNRLTSTMQSEPGTHSFGDLTPFYAGIDMENITLAQLAFHEWAILMAILREMCVDDRMVGNKR